MPGCTRAARWTDLDHTIAWIEHGPTLTANLGLLCRTHHVLKHLGGWHLDQPRPGEFTWTTALGHTYSRGEEHPHIEPLTPSPPNDPPDPGDPPDRAGRPAIKDQQRLNAGHDPDSGHDLDSRRAVDTTQRSGSPSVSRNEWILGRPPISSAEGDDTIPF